MFPAIISHYANNYTLSHFHWAIVSSLNEKRQNLKYFSRERQKHLVVTLGLWVDSAESGSAQKVTHFCFRVMGIERWPSWCWYDVSCCQGWLVLGQGAPCMEGTPSGSFVCAFKMGGSIECLVLRNFPPGTPLQHLTSGRRTRGRASTWAGCSPVGWGGWVKGINGASACTTAEKSCLLLVEDVLARDGIGQSGWTLRMATGQHWAQGPKGLGWCFSFLGDLVA